MKLNELSNKKGSVSPHRRVGRGTGSGRGGTSGRGMKGQKSRSGVALNGFEGGQMPIYRRLPKRGFSNVRFAKKLDIVNLGRIQQAIDSGKLAKDKVIDGEALVSSGLISRFRDGVRILSVGELKDKVTIKAYGISASALEKLTKAGGTFEQFPVKREMTEEEIKRNAARKAAKEKRVPRVSDEETDVKAKKSDTKSDAKPDTKADTKPDAKPESAEPTEQAADPAKSDAPASSESDEKAEE